MNLYLWKRVSDATWRMHDEAGVVIIGLNLASARYMFRAWQIEHNCFNDRCAVYLLDPTEAIPIAPRAPIVYVFPDAGCC